MADENFVVIQGPTTADMIADGYQVDVDTVMASTDSPKLREEAGFKWPVVVSSIAFGIISGASNENSYAPQDPNAVETLEAEGQSLVGRMWDTLHMAMFEVRRMIKDDDHLGSFSVYYSLRYPQSDRWVSETRQVDFYISLSELEPGKPCFVIYRPEEY